MRARGLRGGEGKKQARNDVRKSAAKRRPGKEKPAGRSGGFFTSDAGFESALLLMRAFKARF
jgi:hypothetical protein